MGLCQGRSIELRRAMQDSDEIDKTLQRSQKDEQKIIKLLLLGTGESGKSTIFKQMQLLYKDGFDEYQRVTYRHVVRRNIVESMQTLLTGASRFGFQLRSNQAVKAAEFILLLDPLAENFWVQEIVSHIKALWPSQEKKWLGGEEAVFLSYKNRAKLQLPDSASYLFENIDRIGRPDFSPEPQDILRARLRTSGIVELKFNLNNVEFQFVDVGGQRNERRKWIHCFQDVTAIIFVAAISEYDQVLFEDEKENRLHEAVRVFDNICNNPYFTKTPMILFLNKMDLFRDKIANVPLSTCFSDYLGDNSENDAKEFIRSKFFAVNTQNKDIFYHFTCATDTGNVQKVFEDVRKVILKKNLEKLGLYG